MKSNVKLLTGVMLMAAIMHSFGQPVITQQPTNQMVYVGETAAFNVIATGNPPPSYQWRFNSTDLLNETGSSLSLVNVEFTNAGPYSVVVANDGGAITSQAAWLSVLPTDVVNLGDRELRFGAPVELAWETPETLAAFPHITPDGLTLFFASDRPDGLGQRDIWVTTRPTLAAPWGTPVNLGEPVNTEAIEDDPFLSPDGLSLYFDSTRPGGQGNRDLWVSTRPSRTEPFGAPVNLGPAINSSAYEATGWVSRDNLTLLFGTERSGRSDIWMSTRSSPTNLWQAAQNLGGPINVPAGYETTPYLSTDGLTLFFHSDRHRFGIGSPWASRRSTVASAFGPPALIRHISDMTETGGADFPMLSADEATLYFNTYPDGYPGRTVLWQSSITILPQLRAVGRNSAGEFQFELLGREGANYEIGVSTDFSAWTPWTTTNTSTSASVLLSDPAPAPEGHRFYRALSH